VSDYLAFLRTILGLFTCDSSGQKLKQGEAAPEFKLRDQTGKMHCSADYRGHWLVLYFYPKDDTPGCSAEACSFRDGKTQLDDMNVVLLGVSTDGEGRHQRFSDKYHLTYPLLSDIDGNVSGKYGSLFRFGPLKFAKRHTFIVNPGGNIARIFRSVSPARHGDEIITELQELMQDSN
jgi:thioredoxin-dependent peroxiredoxin